MEKPLVSVIIPAYNHEKYIGNCLDSIIDQTYDNIELILLNDGSLDDTNNKIISYENKLKERFIRYEYINKKNEGVCKTLNKGLSISRGKYIIPFASDDVMYSERIKKQVEFLEENSQYGIVYSDGYNVQSDGYLYTADNYDDRVLFSKNMKFVEGDLFHFMLSNVFFMPTPTICVRKECYEIVGNYDEDILCEDPDMFIRISKYFRIGFIKEPLVLHRLHMDNNGKKRDVIETSIKSMITKYKNSNLLNNSEREILILMLERMIGIINFDYVNGKRIIAWGTGGAYRKFKEKNKTDIEFFIDTDITKNGKTLDGKEIFDPSILKEINKEEYYVIVLSMFYKEIHEILNEYGFTYKENYY